MTLPFSIRIFDFWDALVLSFVIFFFHALLRNSAASPTIEVHTEASSSADEGGAVEQFEARFDKLAVIQFLGIGMGRPYSIPPELEQRWRQNWSQFTYNYGVLTLFLFTLTVAFTALDHFAIMGTLSCIWTAILYQTSKKGQINVFGKYSTIRQTPIAFPEMADCIYSCCMPAFIDKS